MFVEVTKIQNLPKKLKEAQKAKICQKSVLKTREKVIGGTKIIGPR
jgi:hypothetical protein